MHFAIAVVIACSVAVAGALGYGFRGAIHKELTVSAEEAEAWANRLETGAEALAKSVAAELRARLSKL